MGWVTTQWFIPFKPKNLVLIHSSTRHHKLKTLKPRPKNQNHSHITNSCRTLWERRKFLRNLSFAFSLSGFRTVSLHFRKHKKSAGFFAVHLNCSFLELVATFEPFSFYPYFVYCCLSSCYDRRGVAVNCNPSSQFLSSHLCLECLWYQHSGFNCSQRREGPYSRYVSFGHALTSLPI